MQKFLIAAVLVVALVAAAFFSSSAPEASLAPSATSTAATSTSAAPVAATSSSAASTASGASAPAPVVAKPVSVVTPAPVVAPAPVTAPVPAPKDPNAFTAADVAAHGTEENCWTSINGNVYDVTAFFGRHPGGDRNILRLCGKDGTAAFERQHGGSGRANSTLDDFIIGTLVN